MPLFCSIKKNKKGSSQIHWTPNQKIVVLLLEWGNDMHKGEKGDMRSRVRDSRGQVSSTFRIRDGGQEPQQPLAKPRRKKEGQEEKFVHRIPTRDPVHSPSVDISSAWA